MKFCQIIHRDPQQLRGQIVSVIGGGGKSTLIERIGQELRKKDFRVILTATTKLKRLPKIGLVLSEESPNFVSELEVLLRENKIALVAQNYYKEDTLKGVSRTMVPGLTAYADIVLVEADGSRQRPLKTHKPHEPPIPVHSNTVIIVCGANVVGEPLSSKQVHRMELFAEKWNLSEGTTLTPEVVARELLSPHSYLRNVPLRAEIRYFVNKCDLNEIGGRLLAEHLMRKCPYPVFLGSLKQNQLADVRHEFSKQRQLAR